MRMTSAIEKLATIAEVPDGKEVAVATVPTPQRKRKKLKLDPVEDEVGDAVVPFELDQPQDRNVNKRQPRDSPLLSDLIEVVEYAMSLETGAASQKMCRAKFPKILHSNVLSKWKAKYLKYKLWLMPKELAQTMRQVPNFWIEEHKLDAPLRARDTIAGVPRPIADMVNKAVSEATMGLTDATKRADACQDYTMVNRSLRKAMDKYNENSEALVAQIRERNQEAWADFKRCVQVGPDEEKPSMRKIAQEVRRLKSNIKKVPRSFAKWAPHKASARRLLHWYQHSRRRTNTAGNYLAYTDPRMQHARCKVRNLLLEHNIDRRMVLNLD